MHHTHTNLFKKTNLFFLIPISIMTFGIYYAYWFISRKNSFNKINPKNRIPSRWWKFFLVFTIISLLYDLIKESLFTGYGIAVLDSYDLIISFYFVGCLYYSIFRAREMIEEHVEERVFKPWLLVLFNVWYLQFKINRLEGMRREL
ncbi:DUF4234 domain-containing protein [Rossellomorea sp. AcN35-11]|nr:DUF4234 domain-containing protein [Rossellomorea aquimaris]NMH67382.1 DUF4234 domain-containing protein [Bacillus sp. RO3]WJV30303.1 DUF4234 domain-containing protein [Rossellomorea sp. AcN35-11]